ncbi:MAG: efflux RND transporter periplasmic adaptor subunit [Gammaproteobacteria bacterium]|nr:efflux RND transporter periplasmic adaptor subunit [Gammaproteobacteria bacterium]MYK82845.1 efflux RND transporter periplasmic adaptor subunit [Gammaproteobacteria bacterium]
MQPRSLVMGLSLLAIACSPVEERTETGNTPQAQGQSPTTALSTPVQVRVAPVQSAQLHWQASVPGVIEAFRKAVVAAEVDARVVVRSVEPGDPVQAGQPLVVLDDERARIARDQAAADLRRSEANAAQADSELVRGRDLFARQFISEDRLDALRFAVRRNRAQAVAAKAQLAAAQRALADTTVRAPFAGTAEQIHVQAGDYLKRGAAVATVADFSRARVRAGVTASEASRLAGAQTAELALDALGGHRLSGRIQSVARLSEPASGTYPVEIWVEDPEGVLREGMVATVHVPYAAVDSPASVPAEAVFRRGGAMHVFVVESERAHLRPVRIGRTGDGQVEIIDGLATGETVVIDGQFALRDGAQVTIVGGS